MNAFVASVSFVTKRSAPALAACVSASLLMTSPTRAQTVPPPTATPPTAPVQLEAVQVTGSSIKRIDGETALPVLIVTLDDIQRTGASDSEQLLKSIPITSTFGSTNVANTGAGGGQGGAGSLSTVSLRGLGAARTLVLINGRRNASTGGSAVDIDSIPIAAIDHLEILKDGASAIYGSDAVAGVVNFILKRQFTGTEVSTTVGAPTRAGGGTEEKVSLYTGFNDPQANRYSVTFGATYSYIKPIFGSTRTFARNLDVANQLDKTSTTSFPANVRLNNGTLVSPTYPNCGPYSEVSALSPGLCRYDNAPYDALQPRTKMFNVIASARYKLGPAAELYTEPMFTRRKTLNTQQHVLINGAALPAGAPYITTLTNLLNNQYPQFPQLKTLIGSAWALLPPTSQYYPTAWANSVGLNGQPLVLLFRSIPTGVRLTEDVNDNKRIVTGVRGTVAGWDYDAGLLYSQYKITDSLKGGWAKFDQYLNLINSGVINPFGTTTDPTAVQAALDSNYNGVFTTTTTTVTGGDAKATRELFKLPAGMMNIAIGGELRHEKLDINPSDANRNFLVSGFGAAGVPTTASRNVQSAYAETNVPIAKDMTALKSLEADAAVRFDSYERVGNTTNPKGSIRWQPVDKLLLRAAAGSGFRAPTLFDLFQPVSHGISTNGSRDLVRCPTGTTGIIDCSTQFVTNGGGNPNLKPEKSLSVSSGLTFEPTKNYSIGVDWFRLSVTDIIQTGQTVATILGDPVANASYIHRGTPDGNPSGAGPIIGIDQNLTNLGKTNVEGYDVDLAARFAFGTSDRLSLRLNGSYITRYDQQALTGVFSSIINKPAVIGVALRWRHTAGIDWKHGAWMASLSQNYQVGYHDLRTSLQTVATTPVPRMVAPYETYDGQVSYNGFKAIKLTLGVKNLFDRDPPYTNYGGGFVGAYDLSYTDVRGRFVYLTATYSIK